jgi:hypothetical protein
MQSKVLTTWRTVEPVSGRDGLNAPVSMRKASMLDRQTATSYLSSIVALALGIVLTVSVSAFFSFIGWGGEWASQTAGAASGAAFDHRCYPAASSPNPTR